jgi:hypothetical protein
MINKLILITLLLIAPSAFACQYDYDCAVGEYCKRGAVDFNTQEGICIEKTEFQKNPGSIFKNKH